jgi:hypothetical protein
MAGYQGGNTSRTAGGKPVDARSKMNDAMEDIRLENIEGWDNGYV